MSEILTIGEPMVMFLDDTAEVFAEARRLPRKMAGAELNVALGARRLEHSVGYITQLGDEWLSKALILRIFSPPNRRPLDSR
jgi:2-dehydro-3-deoxygluconokinase